MFHTRPSPFKLTPIGKIWNSHRELDMQFKHPTPDHECAHTIEIDAAFFDGSIGLETTSHLAILYWLGSADRTVLKSNSSDSDFEYGAFATLSLDRPNPIGLGAAKILRIEKNLIFVKGNLDCPTGTALLDLRPLTCLAINGSQATN